MGDFVLRLLPIVSNLSFLLPAKRALEYGRGSRFFLFMLIVFASSLYHLCIGFPVACLWSALKHHVVDFWTAELVLPVTALYFINFRAPFVEKWLIWISVITVGLLVTGTESTFFSQVFIGGASAIVIVVYVAWHRIVHGYWPDYDLVQLTLGTAFALFSVTFFIVQNNYPPGYDYLHSLWHVNGAVSQYFFLGIKAPADYMLNLESRIPLPGTVDEGSPSLYRILTVPKWARDGAEFRKGARPLQGDGSTFIEGFAFAPIENKKPQFP